MNDSMSFFKKNILFRAGVKSCTSSCCLGNTGAVNLFFEVPRDYELSENDPWRSMLLNNTLANLHGGNIPGL